MEIAKTRNGYEIETTSVLISIVNGLISTDRPAGIRELDCKKFSTNDEALDCVKSWHAAQIKWSSKNTVIGFGG